MHRAAALLLLTVGCAAPSGLTPEGYGDILAFQDAVAVELARGEADLFNEGLLFELPDGVELEDLDLHGRTGQGIRITPEAGHAVIVTFDGAVHVTDWDGQLGGTAGANGELSRYSGQGRPQDGEFLAAAGRALTGFDAIRRYAVCDAGFVIVAERGGEQLLIHGDSVREGTFLDPAFRPELSVDGSMIAFVTSSMFGQTAWIAPVAAIERAVEPAVPGELQWPIELGPDGAHWWAIADDADGRLLVGDGEVVGRFEGIEYRGRTSGSRLPIWEVHLDGQERFVVGDAELPWFDDARWLMTSDDGAVLACVGTLGGLGRAFVDARVVLEHAAIESFRLSASGEAWGAAVREEDGIHVVHGDARHGPYQGIFQLVPSRDGRTIAYFAKRDDGWSWFVDGAPLGESFDRVEKPLPLDERGGVIFQGKDDAGWNVVTPASTSGPWDWVGDRMLSADGRRLAFVAGRGREVWRRVLNVR